MKITMANILAAQSQCQTCICARLPMLLKIRAERVPHSFESSCPEDTRYEMVEENASWCQLISAEKQAQMIGEERKGVVEGDAFLQFDNFVLDMKDSARSRTDQSLETILNIGRIGIQHFWQVEYAYTTY